MHKHATTCHEDSSTSHFLDCQQTILAYSQSQHDKLNALSNRNKMTNPKSAFGAPLSRGLAALLKK